MPVIFLLLFFAQKNVPVILTKLISGELRCPVTALFKKIVLASQKKCKINKSVIGQS